MSRIATFTDKAPAPLPVFNQAIVANGFVYTSGSIAQDPATGKIIDGDIQAHTVRPTLDTRSWQSYNAKESCHAAPSHPEPLRRS